MRPRRHDAPQADPERGQRYPEPFAVWREDGPGKIWAALAARFARLAYAGHLDLDDPDVAARQFLALINAELQIPFLFGDPVSDEALDRRRGAGRPHLPPRLPLPALGRAVRAA